MATDTKERPLEKSTLSGWTFAVEADTRRNGDILLQSIPGQRLRGAIDASKPIIAHPKQNERDFEPTIPIDQTMRLGSFPKVPGQQIFVNPAKRTYKIFDPLRDNEELCNRLVAALKTKQMVTGGKINGVKTITGKIDVDQMKTLCRELRWLVESGDAKIVPGAGDLPSFDDIDKMNGNYLLNPGARIQNSQPRYEKDYEGWVQRLSQGGG